MVADPGTSMEKLENSLEELLILTMQIWIPIVH
jgi:hypothetical protein